MPAVGAERQRLHPAARPRAAARHRDAGTGRRRARAPISAPRRARPPSTATSTRSAAPAKCFARGLRRPARRWRNGCSRRAGRCRRRGTRPAARRRATAPLGRSCRWSPAPLPRAVASTACGRFGRHAQYRAAGTISSLWTAARLPPCRRALSRLQIDTYAPTVAGRTGIEAIIPIIGQNPDNAHVVADHGDTPC